MHTLIKFLSKSAWTLLLLLAFACGTKAEHTTGDDAGETNRKNATVEKPDDTGTLPTSERNDAETGSTQGQDPRDSTNTDSTQVTPRMQRKE